MSGTDVREKSPNQCESTGKAKLMEQNWPLIIAIGNRKHDYLLLYRDKNCSLL